MSIVTALIRDDIVKRGWKPGSSLEDRVARELSRLGMGPPKGAPDEVLQQHKIGPYRVDFAFPDVKVALEADGPYHLTPRDAIKDARRDADLRAEGWITLRVDDQGMPAEEGYIVEPLTEQILRVVIVVRALRRWDR